MPFSEFGTDIPHRDDKRAMTSLATRRILFGPGRAVQDGLSTHRTRDRTVEVRLQPIRRALHLPRVIARAPDDRALLRRHRRCKNLAHTLTRDPVLLPDHREGEASTKGCEHRRIAFAGRALFRHRPPSHHGSARSTDVLHLTAARSTGLDPHQMTTRKPPPLGVGRKRRPPVSLTL